MLVLWGECGHFSFSLLSNENVNAGVQYPVATTEYITP